MEPEDLTHLQKRFSFSSISETTCSSVSGVVNRHVNTVNTTSNLTIDNFVKDLNGAPQSNFRIEGSSGIRVGDAIYHIYYPPPKEGS